MKTSRLLVLKFVGSVIGLFLGISAAGSAQTTGGPYQFYPVSPCRAIDSRVPPGSILPSATARDHTLRGLCGIPSTAKVAVLILTAVSPSADGFLTIWTKPNAFPPTSNITVRAGITLANGATVTLGIGAPDVSIAYGTAVAGSTHYLIDIVGYFQ